MRISDWSSDVCSSDVTLDLRLGDRLQGVDMHADDLDLGLREILGQVDELAGAVADLADQRVAEGAGLAAQVVQQAAHADQPALPCHAGRSEEHTSELPSLMRISYPVFCLKKK